MLPTRSLPAAAIPLGMLASLFALALVPAPTSAAAVKASPVLPFVRQMQREAAVLRTTLTGQRATLLSTRQREEQLAGDAAIVTVGRQRALKAFSRLPVARRHLVTLVAKGSYIERVERERTTRHAKAQLALEAATATAAATQSELADTERRLAALKTALGSAGARPSGPGASYPSYGWGGDKTAPVSAQTINDYLESKASPMAGEGEAFMRSAYSWNLDPRLIIAIAGAESYFGLQLCAPHNAWGWGCPTSPVGFHSWADGIDTVASGLRERYVDGGRTTVDEIHSMYAPQGATNDPNGLNYAWANNVADFLQEQGGNPNNIEGPGKGKGATGVD